MSKPLADELQDDVPYYNSSAALMRILYGLHIESAYKPSDEDGLNYLRRTLERRRKKNRAKAEARAWEDSLASKDEVRSS